MREWFWSGLRSRSICAAAAFCFGVGVFGCGPGIAEKRKAASADGADGPRSYTIAVHLSSNPERSEDAGEVRAIEEFVARRAASVNASGGILGRPLEIQFFNDDLLAEKTSKNIDAALENPNLAAMLGVWSSTRGNGVMERIGRNGVPFISEVSVATLFTPYPNIYTLTRSVRAESELFLSYAHDNGFSRIAFVGAADDLYTRTYFEHIGAFGADNNRTTDMPAVVSTFWLDGDVADNLDAVDEAVAQIKAQNADVVFLSVRSQPGAEFLERMRVAGVSVPIFVGLGSVQGILRDEGGRRYGGGLYEIAEGGVANLNNERLRQLMRSPGMVSSDSGYKANQIGYGARYSDLLSMMVEGANESASPSLKHVRAAISAKLAGLRENHKYWAGGAQNWTFTKDRASAEQALLVWSPPGEARRILAPIQYVRSDNKFMRVPVLYVHLDMIRVFGVDSNDKSFEAEFFFTTRSEVEVPIDAIEFTNSYRGKVSKEPIISIRQVHERRGGDAGAGGTKIYKVSGRFSFEPDLARYPFDEQVFSISFQPSKTSSAFFLQPPSKDLRSKDFDVDGWSTVEHYVGTRDLIIRSVSGPVLNEYVIPYYTFNYTWVMRRQVIDYILRVIVPLSCILIVSYLAVFIPRIEFNATIAIQVTALLSAIALYFALNQPQADDATLSDLIFVGSYASIALMIALSIFEINEGDAHAPRVMSLVRVMQIFMVPVITFGILFYLILR